MCYGTITDETFETTDSRLPGRRYVWRPAPDVPLDLPPNFSVSMIASTTATGVRWFAPEWKLSDFLKVVAAGGLALLSQQWKLGHADRRGYREMLLVFEQATLYREHLSRKYHSSADLMVKQAGDSNDGQRHVLPDNLGVTDAHLSWLPRDLIRAGRESIVGRPINIRESIRRGFQVASRSNPISPNSLTSEQAFVFVRLGLFDLGTTPAVDSEKQELAELHFLDALDDHLTLESAEFSSWFFNLNGIVRAVSKKRDIASVMSRDEVRNALLNMTLKAHKHVGHFIDAMMIEFLRAIPDELSNEERALFLACYSSQAHFGDLPLVMLAERYDFARESFEDLMCDPLDPTKIGTLQRLLDFYAQMSHKRRVADRGSKARKRTQTKSLPRTNHRDQQEQSEPVPDTSVDKPVPKRMRNTWNEEVRNEIRRRRTVTCRCGDEAKWESELTNDETAGLLCVNDWCTVCETVREWSVSYDEYQEIAMDQTLRA